MKKNNLVILSLPFQRLIRSHMSPVVLDILSTDSDLLIVTPFANDSGFVERYGRSNIKMILPPSEEKLFWFFRRLFVISSLLRVQGYWYRRKEVLLYFFSNRHLHFGENGEDKKFSFLLRLRIDVLSLLGYSSRTWRIFDFLHGQRTYRFPELFEVTTNYQKVVFIQAASWGFQDAVMGYWARTKKWRSIMLPYTTDQLFCNGWLYCNFNKVCVQGEYELKVALELHNYTLDSIVNLGSLNAFAMREVLRNKNSSNTLKLELPFQILFAGVTATYFPTESEFYCLDILLDAVNSGKFGNSQITYRPIGHNKEIRAKIENRYGNSNNIKIEYANPSVYGLDKFENIDYSTLLNDYVTSILPYDLLVMAFGSSLCLDIAYLNKPSISVFIDNSGVLEKRNTNYFFNNKERFHHLECVPTIFTKESLIQLIQLLIESPNEREKIVKGLNLSWDFPNTNVRLALKKAIYES